jgi:signal transduction histidine kinase/DNA-binding response OmpR family regulator
VFLVYFYKDLKKETIIKYENEMGMLGYESASYLSHELKDLSENVHKISLKVVKKDTLTFEYLRGIINTIINSDKHVYGSGVFFDDYKYDPNAANAYIYRFRNNNVITELNYTMEGDDSLTFKNQEWWYEVFKAKHGHWTKPYYDKFGKTYMITYSFPIIINKECVGVLSADIDLKSLVNIAEKSNTSLLNLIDADHLAIISRYDTAFIYSPDSKKLGRSVENVYNNTTAHNIIQKVNNIISTKYGVSNITVKKKEFYLFYAPLQSTDWILISWIDKSVIDNLISMFLIKRIAFSILSIILLIILIIIIALYFVKPAKKLSEITLKVAEGNFDIPVDINTRDELGVLARNLDKMKERLKQREINLKEASENMKTLLDNIPFAVIEYNIDGNPVFFNRSALELLQLNDEELKKSEIINKDWIEFVNTKYRKQVEKVFEGELVIVEGDDVLQDTPWFKNPLKGKYIQFHFIPYNEKGRTDSIIEIIIDLTEVKQNESLWVEKKSAELANKAKDEFLARMSHEIRTPLNAIIGFVDIALRKYTPKEQVYIYLLRIKQSASHLLNIVNDILDYSKIESGEMLLEHNEFDLEDVMLEMFNLFTTLAHKKDLEFILVLSPLIPFPLFGDPVKLKQVLFNLVNNAVKFTGKGEIYVEVDVKQSSRNKVKLLFKVKDTGIGLTKEQTEKLFQPFVQAEQSISREFGGTGIGLTISKKIVDLMGGKIWIESEGKNKGTTFLFTAEFETAGTSYKFNQYLSKFHFTDELRNLNVLVCDDNKTTLNIIETILKAFKYTVTTVDSGNDVIKLLESGKKYDLLIIDKIMPAPDGFETMEIILNKDLRKNLKKVILISAYEEETDVDKLTKFGINFFQSKPLGYSSLFNSIVTVFKQKTGAVSIDKNIEERKTIEPVFNTGNCTILVVDDNELNREVAGDLIETTGISVEFAVNGKEAVDKVKNSGIPSKYCLVFMDIQMPVMNGYEASQAIRKIKEYKKLPIIAMTADIMPGVKEKCFDSGMNHFISKPIDPGEVIASISKWAKNIVIKNVEKPDKVSVDKQFIGINHINVSEGVKRIGGNPEKFINLLVKFSTNYKGFISRFEQIETKEEKLKVIHAFKGLTGNISAEKLYNMVVSMESKIKKDEDYTALTALVDEELNLVIQETEQLAAQQNAVKSKENKLSEKEIQNIVDKIKKLLEDYNPDALDELNKIKSYFENNKIFSDLISDIESYRFDEALEKISSLTL